MIQVMDRAPIGPTGWATIANGPRERININSRGCVEVIRGLGRTNDRLKGPYGGWCSCAGKPEGAGVRPTDPIVEAEVLAGAWRWHVWITDQLVWVERHDDAGSNASFEFALTSPDYTAPTQGILEEERKRHF